MNQSAKIGLVIVVVVSFLVSGLFVILTPEEAPSTEEPEAPIAFSTVDGIQKVRAGESTMQLLKVENKEDVPHNLTFAVGETPSGWTASINRNMFGLDNGETKGLFVTIDIPSGTGSGSFDIIMNTFIDGATTPVTYAIPLMVIEPHNVVEDGDSVSMEYIGYTEDFKIFDTSVIDAGTLAANGGIDKLATFSGGSYQPFQFVTGSGSAIKGFNDGVLGLEVGQSRCVVVPPEDGYGRFTNISINLTDSTPVFETIRDHTFNATYAGESIQIGLTVSHRLWGWETRIKDYKNGWITLENLPINGQTYTPFGWNSVVTDIDSTANGGVGEIKLTHSPPAVGSVVSYAGHDATVISLDATQVTIEYNTSTHDLGHETLIFQIRLISKD